MTDVVALGEAMLRLSPPRFERLEQATTLHVVVGGSELSVAANLSRLGASARWVTALPADPLGRMVANAARAQGVDTSGIRWVPEGRVGVYYYEEGAAPRPSQVIYDRRGSACSMLQPGDVEWDAVLRGARIFHTCGITPALSAGCRALAIEGLRAARSLGVATSFDLNYRSRLWTVDEAAACYREVAPLVDVMFASASALETFFGLAGDAETVARRAIDRFGIRVVVLTERMAAGMLGATITSMAVADRVYQGRSWDVEIVDRLGAGDAYDAGFLFGYLQGDLEKAVAYAGAMAALQQTIPGEFAWVTEEDVQAALAGGPAQVRR